MNSLNKYYKFLSENNISTYDNLKNYIEQDIFKLKIKEDKNNSNLAVIFNDKDSNIDNEFVRSLDFLSARSFCYWKKASVKLFSNLTSPKPR